MRISKIVFVLPLVLPALPTFADTSFTATGWLTGVPVPGILCTNTAGQMYLKGNVHVLRLESAEPRMIGRLQAMPDVAFQADGTRVFTGAAYVEVGTWDTTGTNFTRGDGVWDLSYRGVTQADGSLQYNLAGYGIGGTIDNLRLEAAAARGPGPTFDPTIPYLATGTIKPAPVNNCALIDDFNDGNYDGWDPGANAGIQVLSAADGRLTGSCDWTGVPTANPLNTLAWAGHNQRWTVSSSQTVELRADLVGLNPAADSATLAFAVQQSGPNYVLQKGHSWLMMVKHSGTAFAALCGASVVTPDTNVVMSLALTRVGQNLVLTGRVYDKSAPNNLLGQLSYLDTPSSDPVLSSPEIAGLVGGTVPGFGPDPGPFWTTGQRVWLGVWQYTDGTKPAAQASFDNPEFCTYEVPPLGIERAVRISWPATGMNYAVEAASSLQGPWLPVRDAAVPGIETLYLPANNLLEVFRLIRTP
jgi:hypothetical protein